MTQLAQNAQPILSARLRGFRPDEMIMVSITGRVYTANQVVYAKPDEAYDWRWVRGLDICVRIAAQADWIPTLEAIERCDPAYLCVWHEIDSWGAHVRRFPTLQDIESGAPRCAWTSELDFTEWMAFENRDFAEGRKYYRDDNGVPYAAYS